MLGLMSVAFLAACEKQPTGNNPVNLDNNIVYVDENTEVEDNEIDNSVVDVETVENNVVESMEVEVENQNSNWPRTSLTISDLDEIDTLFFPRWYSYERYGWDNPEVSESWEYFYPDWVDHKLLLPVHETMVSREVVSSKLDSWRIYTLTNVTLEDWWNLSVLYVNDATTLEYMSASVSDDVWATLYVFKY